MKKVFILFLILTSCNDEKTCTAILTKEFGEIVCQGGLSCSGAGCFVHNCSLTTANQDVSLRLDGNAIYKEGLKCPKQGE